MVGFRGRFVAKQYIPNKPTKYGIKALVVVNSYILYKCHTIRSCSHRDYRLSIIRALAAPHMLSSLPRGPGRHRVTHQEARFGDPDRLNGVAHFIDRGTSQRDCGLQPPVSWKQTQDHIFLQDSTTSLPHDLLQEVPHPPTLQSIVLPQPQPPPLKTKQGTVSSDHQTLRTTHHIVLFIPQHSKLVPLAIL